MSYFSGWPMELRASFKRWGHSIFLISLNRRSGKFMVVRLSETVCRALKAQQFFLVCFWAKVLIKFCLRSSKAYFYLEILPPFCTARSPDLGIFWNWWNLHNRVDRSQQRSAYKRWVHPICLLLPPCKGQCYISFGL